MRLVLERALFDVASGEEAIALVDLLTTVARDKHLHAVLTDPPYLPGGNNGPIDIWLTNRDPREGDAFRAVLANGLLIDATYALSGGASDSVQPRRWHLEGPLSVRVERRPMSDWRSRKLTLADAADLMHEPVHLVLENARTDRYFVCHLASPTDSTTLQALLEQPGRIMRHGGGSGEIKRWLEELTKGTPTSATWRMVLRAWVLFDRDSGDSDACEISRSAKDIIEACEKVVASYGAGLSWVCLCRREIESYVPDRGLLAEALRDQSPFAQQVVSWRADPLRAPWAWALDLKKGLRGDLRNNLPKADRTALNDGTLPLEAHMLKAPFAGLSSGDLIILDSGFGERLSKALRETPPRSWTSDLRAEYDRGPADQAPRLSFVQSLFDRM